MHYSSNSDLNSNASSAQTNEQQDLTDASPGAMDARVTLNNRKLDALKAQVHDNREHKACVERGERSGGFKCVVPFCHQNVPYIQKSFVCKKCGHDHYIYFKEKEKALREEIKALEDAIFQEGKKKVVPGKK